MTDYREVVTGRVVTDANAPVSGATVEMYDKDMLQNDYLGSATTSADGRFEIAFNWSDFRNDFGLPEGRPDIFLKIRSPAGKTTKTDVYHELSGELSDDDSEERMDLGDVKIDA